MVVARMGSHREAVGVVGHSRQRRRQGVSQRAAYVRDFYFQLRRVDKPVQPGRQALCIHTPTHEFEGYFQ